MPRGIITLTTDFSPHSPYVAQMKGAILSVHPDVDLIDVTHAVPPQDLLAAALVLESVVECFPPRTIHVAVVDPGVGTQRAILYVAAAGQQFVVPDNGLLTLVTRRHSPSQIVRLDACRYWRQPVSRTFHGRDIMGPVAAHLSRGVPPASLGPAQSGLVQLELPVAAVHAHGIAGQIMSIDAFGNAVTNIPQAVLCDGATGRSLRICCRDLQLDALVATYGQSAPGETVALIGSGGRLEIAVVHGNAARQCGLHVGDPVRVSWR